MKRHQQGVTLLEILVCLAIVAVVAAIATPVFANAKRGALERRSVSDMKGIALAAMLYRQDSKESEFGTMEAMGLPTSYTALFGSNALKTRSYPRPPIHWGSYDWYYWMPLPSAIDGREITWQQATLKYGERTVLVCDPWFEGGNGKSALAWDPQNPNRLNGVALDGGLIRKRDYGDFYDFDRWR